MNLLTRCLPSRSILLIVVMCCTASFPVLTIAQTDPGPRSGTPDSGGPISGLDPNQTQAFLDGQERFNDVEDVPTGGLGPRFNSNSCVSCHSQPAAGGTSPAVNPQTSFANSRNTLPSFITPSGPAREARFINNSSGQPDGSVHALFVITGRPDAPSGCNIAQENFSNSSNISLRIPTPLFGLGLIEAIPDAFLLNNLNSTAGARGRLGIGGSFNMSGNDTTITRFGWKAQNKSLEMFSGEAYNVEMGISNLIFPNERSVPNVNDFLNCSKAAIPNDDVNLGGAGVAEFDDVTGFSVFARFLAAPGRGTITNSVTNGANVFTNIGCAMCHTTTLQTGPSRFAALSNKTIHPYSDFALHHMGPGLADQISQGAARGDQFRTAPLWGLGERLFLLHDGRTSDLVQAIQAHSSSGNSQFPSSEANRVISNYNSLSASNKQSLLNFLRSL